ncbi:MAG TPA: tetratricopeptide repeat protein, partial [Elusimicrobiales bacterium]|nr:tetratricopeptide repeat protein [Elusimicrobiales bacterium]
KQLSYWYLAQSYRKAGKPDKALPTLQLAVQLYPENLELLLSLAELYHETALYSQAKNLYERVLESDPEDSEQLPRLHAGLARTYEALGYLSRAAENYKKAMELDESHVNALLKDYSACLLKQRKYAEAGTAVTKALAAAPQDSELLFLSAKINYATGQKEAATARLTTALEKDPGRDDIRLTLALWLISAGNYRQAEAQAEQVYSRHPDSAQAQWALGLTMINSSGKKERALALLRKAASSISSPFTAEIAQLLLDKAGKKQTHQQ